MPSSSKLVNTSDVFELRLVHYLGEHDATSPFVVACETHVTEANAPSLLRTILEHKPALDTLFHKSKFPTDFDSSEDGIHAFSLLCVLLDRVEDGSELQEIIKVLVQAVEDYTSDEVKNSDLVEKKMKMLCALYNLRSEAREKCWILGRIFTVCVSGGNDECTLSLLPGRNSTLGTLLEKNNLETLLVQLDEGGELQQSDKRALYATASDVVGKVADLCRRKEMEKEASAADEAKQLLLLKMLSTYDTVADVDEVATDAAKHVAVGAVCFPFSLFNEQRCIMSLPPVLALEKDPETKSLFALLSIFQQGKLEDFQSFQESNPDALDKYSISSTSAKRHMRLLSLCSLATEHEEIPYDAIAKTLQVNEDDVESWVIDAVSSGLLSAKMDQLEKVVLVERCVVRKFGIEQWKILQKRVDLWKKNVRNVLEGLKQSQAGVGI
mmetsp:Transcript_16068/g.19620  ORF Transcript_16068/g.19620 Transcript_16068/m.19620 type:complete len:439 (+) Transcript_16068:217-1533(+)